MPAAAIVGFGGLLVLAFGVRTVIHRSRTGDAGWRPPPTAAAWAGDGLFTVGVAATMAAPVLDLLDVITPIDALNRPPVHAVGTALLAGGGGTALLAQSQMGAAWRAGIDLSAGSELVRGGLFRLVRNPFYAGIMLAAAGVVLMVPNAIAVGGWLAVVLGCEIDVRVVEEPHLRAANPGYREYASATGRFVPGLGRTSKS